MTNEQHEMEAPFRRAAARERIEARRLAVAFPIPTSKLHNGYAEASELGLKVGEWPETVMVEGLSFRKVTSRWDREGDLVSVDYFCDTYVITIVND